MYRAFGEMFRKSATSRYVAVADATAACDELGCVIVIINTSRILLSVKCNGTLKLLHQLVVN